MEIYDTEEEQVEALKRWWKANGSSLIAGVIVAVVLIGSWNFWQSYQKDKANQASALYQKLLESDASGDHEAVAKISKRLSEQYSSTAYSGFAALFQAKNLVKQGDLEGAKSILQQLARESSNDEIQHIARVRLVRIMEATNEYEKGLQLIADADASTSDGFGAIYDELKGDLYADLGRLGEARTAYKSALRSGQHSPLLQFKLDDITAAEIMTETDQ